MATNNRIDPFDQPDQPTVIPLMTGEIIQTIQTAYTTQARAFAAYRKAKETEHARVQKAMNNLLVPTPEMYNEANEALVIYQKAQHELMLLMTQWLPTLLSIAVQSQALVYNQESKQHSIAFSELAVKLGFASPETAAMQERVTDRVAVCHEEIFTRLIALFVPMVE